MSSATDGVRMTRTENWSLVSVMRMSSVSTLERLIVLFLIFYFCNFFLLFNYN